MKIAVCAICRNEVDYVEEWVAYYKVSGFDSVFIYDNVSDDGTSELLTALDNIGEITRVHWPRREGIPPQRDAYGHFIESYSADFDYVLICDLDEFLVVKNATVKDLLLDAERLHGNVGAIAFPWLVFGSSGNETPSADLVIERFKKCERKPSPVVKTMFSPKNTYNMRTHICDLLSGVYLDNTLAVAAWNQSMPIKLTSCSFGRAVMHHYYTKSREEWVRRRALPKADRAKQELKNTAEFDKFHSQVHEHSGVNMQVSAVQRCLSELKEKLSVSQAKFGSAKIELVAVSKDWIFGVVHGLCSDSREKIRVTNSLQKETVVYTKPMNHAAHVFIVKTKWRDSFSEDFALSLVGGGTSQAFVKADWPSAKKSIELLVEHCPEAEEHIFTLFIDTLEKAPSSDILQMIGTLKFTKYKIYKDFFDALSAHLNSPKGGHLKAFSESCDLDFLKKVADPGNRRRKFISDALHA
ncbi:glycosyltransferase family 2 protein [Pseudomonas sp. P8_241]|uniref:glycosyltransferase family 2 protein n=1 Tax=Pseudomonas sp. P8_241 TaxID=3043445 RepID=UPI002A36D726|nr:glycosyltransferase family 2 protein [Pseudomonas sp. P8_241]WPN45654.1 glycosyltransferase family 2 protein [Pseudomonas sp. P8_241]